MSPRFDPDFTKVQVTTPTYPKGTYELSINGVNGSAWDKSNDDGTSYQVQRVRCHATMKGVYDSKGNLDSEHPELGEIEGKSVSPIDLYIHSEGALRFAKRQMMAILGYDPHDGDDEEAFNEWIVNAGVDLGFEAEGGGEEGYEVTIGDGWEVLEGMDVVAMLDVEIDKNDETGEMIKRQRIARLMPVGSV